MKRLIGLGFGLVAACAEVPQSTAPVALTVPEARSFAATSPGPAQRPNSEILYDFLDLSFRMESGRELPILTRFEGPVTVRVTGDVPASLAGDLNGLLGRLRSEARIDIQQTNSASANITIVAVPNRTLRRAAPNAACFVVPRVQSWPELRAARGRSTLDWATLDTRTKAAIFLPADGTPQDIRDCLHEELAQALGPLNDLYRLPDSVFNDDNMHSVLTGFDMLILRAYYDPALRSGMTRDAVASRLPGILARINPRGQRAGGQVPSLTSRDWIETVEVALGGNASRAVRQRAALRAVDIASRKGWVDTRLGFANYAFARLQIGRNPRLALDAFNNAGRTYRGNPLTQIHTAHIAVQLAAFTLITGDADATIALTSEAIPVARRYQDASLLSLLMMFQAEALDIKGQSEDAMALRLDSLGWARYGFGNREKVIDRLNEIASLPPSDPAG